MIPAVEKIWMNGTMVGWKQATVHVLTHGLHYGTGVFEGIRCYETPHGPGVFRLREHLERMQRSARVVQMPLGYSTSELEQAVVDLIDVNDLSSCYVRPIAYRGYGSLGLNMSTVPVDVAIAAWPWGAYLGEEALRDGIRMTISAWQRNDPNVIPPDCKLTGAYITACMAAVEASSAGFDEAVMLNPAGCISEATGENIFVVREGFLQTPPVEAGALPGITRASVMDIARDLGIEVEEKLLTRSELYAADEAFCVGTAAEMVPIREVDGRELGVGGPVTRAIQDQFFSIIKGENEKYLDWFTFVRSD